MKTEIRIAGSGGQGIILAGVILGKAASIYDCKYATQTQSYGPEARGGASKTEIIISDESISFPYVNGADVFVALSQQAYDAYKLNLKKDNFVFVDSGLVKPDNGTPAIKIDATCTAKSLGSELAANMIMLGAISEITKTVSIEALEKAMKVSTSERFHSINSKAIQEGASLARSFFCEMEKGEKSCKITVNST